MTLRPRTNSGCWRPAVISVCLLVHAAPATAARVEIACGRDATLFSSCGCYADGAGPSLYSGETRFFGSRRALVWFAVAESIPSGSRIDSVQVRLYVEKTASGTEQHGLHTVLADWTEGPTVSTGGGGAPAVAGDVTWTHTVYPDAPWTTAGGDFAAQASAEAAVGTGGTTLWSSNAGLVADVQGWLDFPQENYGWILLGNEATTSAKRFASREHPTVELRPVLVVDYTPPLAIESHSWGAVKRLFGAGMREAGR